MTGSQYEQFVRAVLVRRLNLSPDKLRAVRRPGVQLSGDRGPKHQIDLLCVDENEIAEYTTIIECKYHKSRKVAQGEIEKLAHVKSSMRASKAILVTNHGFTDGSERVADAEKIALLVITPRINMEEIDGALNKDDLFQAIDAKLQESLHGYDFEVKKKFAIHSNDRSIDLVSALMPTPVVRGRVAILTGNAEVQKVVKPIAKENPNVVRKTMGPLRK